MNDIGVCCQYNSVDANWTGATNDSNALFSYIWEFHNTWLK